MTTSYVFAVRDSALQAFGRPMFSPTPAAMIRSFQDEVNRKADDNPMAQHPDDYELFELGTWNDETGEFANKQRILVRAKDVVKE